MCKMVLCGFLVFLAIQSPAQTTVSSVYVGSGFTKKLSRATDQEAGLGKSIYYRSLPALPLATGPSLSTIRLAKEIGARNVSIEVRTTVTSPDADRVYFGPYTSGAASGYASLIGGIHAQGLAASLKLIFVLPDGDHPLIAKPKNTAQFWESYNRVISRFAKIAQSESAEELVLGTGLSSLICRDPKGFKTALDSARYYYTGRLRLDFVGYSDFETGFNCLAGMASYFDAFGVDFADGASASEVYKSLILGGDKAHSVGAQITASRVSFSGANQFDSYQQFFSELEQMVVVNGARPNLTLGLFDVNPDRATPNDLSANIISKPALEKVKSWFAQF